jgi:hypothetical protein
MLEANDEQIIEGIAALDIGKAELVCCARVPGEGGTSRRRQEATTYSTMTRSLADRLAELQVSRWPQAAKLRVKSRTPPYAVCRTSPGSSRSRRLSGV